VPGNAATAGFRNDPQALPKVGEVFYGAAVVGSIGGCADSAAGIEPVPPVGVDLAISAQNPVRCYYASVQAPSQPVELSPANGCGQTPSQGFFGPRLLSGPGAGGTFPLVLDSQRILTVEFPLRASRPLKGSPSLSCGRRAGVDKACPPEQAGDNLQVNVVSVDGGSNFLAPHVGLFVEPGPAAPAPGTAPSPSPTAPGASPAELRVTAPDRLRLRRALAGVRIAVQVPADGSRVRATLTARGLRGLRGGRVASVSRRSAGAGRLALRLRPRRAAARALRRAGRATLTLRVTVRPPGQPAQRARERIRIRR